MHYIYIVQCSDNSLYTGYTTNITRRINEHNNKKGAKCLKGKLPITLVHNEKYSTKQEAMKREAQIKSYSRKEKLKLIELHS